VGSMVDRFVGRLYRLVVHVWIWAIYGVVIY